MMPGEKAEALISELGILEAEDLDVEAIAFDSGVEVTYDTLIGCDASLVGFKDHAIATITPSGNRGRDRFSIAHEIGHWKLHKGRSFRCRVDQPDQNLVANKPFEKEADTFASHLLMPGSIFNPIVKEYKQPGFKQLKEIATLFETSLLATTLRLANINTLPVVVACYAKSGLKWHVAAGDVPKRWWLNRKLHEDSFAFDLINLGKECNYLGKQSADTWFENDDAGKYEVLEQCVQTTNGEVLVLIYLADNRMLYARFDPSVGNRRYNEMGSYVPKKH